MGLGEESERADGAEEDAGAEAVEAGPGGLEGAGLDVPDEVPGQEGLLSGKLAVLQGQDRGAQGIGRHDGEEVKGFRFQGSEGAGVLACQGARAWFMRGDMKRFLPVLCGLLLLAGCASMSEQGRMVETVGPEAVRGMTFVGNVATSAPLAGVAFQQASYQGALNAALNETARLGGTHLVLDEGTSSRFWGTHQSVRGKAYRREARR